MRREKVTPAENTQVKNLSNEWMIQNQDDIVRLRNGSRIRDDKRPKEQDVQTDIVEALDLRNEETVAAYINNLMKTCPNFEEIVFVKNVKYLDNKYEQVKAIPATQFETFENMATIMARNISNVNVVKVCLNKAEKNLSLTLLSTDKMIEDAEEALLKDNDKDKKEYTRLIRFVYTSPQR